MVCLKSIEIQGMHNVKFAEYNISGCNYFTGPNGSGKTTAMQAIQLALLGYIPGVAKQKSEIFKHKNPNSLSMSVKLTLDADGSPVTIQRTWMGTASNVKYSVVIDPESYDLSNLYQDIELPIFNFSEFTSLTANKLKDWFLAYLPSSSDNVDWDRELNNVLSTYSCSDRLISEFNVHRSSKNLSGLDEVRWANDYFKQLVSFTKQEIDRQQKTMQSLVYYEDIDDDLTDEEINSKISYAQKCRDIRNKYDSDLAYNKKIESELLQFSNLHYDSVENDPEYLDMIQMKYTLDADINDINEKLWNREDYDIIDSETVRLKSEQKTIMTVLSGKGICPYTGTECSEIKSKFDQYTEQNRLLNKELLQLSEDRKELDEAKAALKLHLDEVNRKRSDIEKKLSKLKMDYETKCRLLNQLKTIPDTLPANEDFDSTILKYTELKAKKLANSKYQNLMNSITSKVFEDQELLECYKICVNLTGVNGLQTSLESMNPFVGFNETLDPLVKAMFGETCTSRFNLESKSNSFSMGVVINGNYVTYEMLSSGEKCLYSLCLMTALVRILPSSIKLVMVDDMLDHLDTEHINLLSESLNNVDDVQYVFAGVANINNSKSLNKIELTRR